MRFVKIGPPYDVEFSSTETRNTIPFISVSISLTSSLLCVENRLKESKASVKAGKPVRK